MYVHSDHEAESESDPTPLERAPTLEEREPTLLEEFDPNGKQKGILDIHSSYKNAIDKSRSQVHELFTTADSRFLPPPLMPPVSNPITVHYSFDFAQQVHYPSDPLKPGPIYFLTPRKAALFGVCCAAIPRQVNFVIDEASDTGKGAFLEMRKHGVCIIYICLQYSSLSLLQLLRDRQYCHTEA